MSMSLAKLCRWKYRNGYRYVSINENTGVIEFIKEQELAEWFDKKYEEYEAIQKKNQDTVISKLEYMKENLPDSIMEEYLISS